MSLAGKRVLVTGAGGFIGSHLVEALIDQGAAVRALVFYDRNNSWGWLDTLATEVTAALEVLSGDIRDAGSMRDAMAGVDVVFHLAALISIPYSYVAPESYVDTNIKGTLNVLLAARDAAVGRVLVTSTSEVYGTAQYVPIDEAHPRQGQSPYSASKIGADMLTESFIRSYSMPATTVRPFNTFGPRQSARAIIPTIATQLIAGRDAIELGYLDATRDFNFVADTVQGFIAIAESEATIGREVNIASQEEISIGELATMLIERIRPTSSVQSDVERLRPEQSEVQRLCGSSELIRELTPWEPRHSFEEGLDTTIEWLRQPEQQGLYKNDIYNI